MYLEKCFSDISKLKDGWLNGEGNVPDPDKLLVVARAFVEYYPKELKLPSVMPTPTGDLLFEWFDEALPSLDIDLQKMTGWFHRFDADGKDDAVDFELRSEDDWKKMMIFLKDRIPAD